MITSAPFYSAILQNIGPPELLIVLVIVLIIFGPKKLPGLGKAIGQSIKEFRDGMKNISESIDEPDNTPTKPRSEAESRPAAAPVASREKTDGDKPAQSP